MIRTAVLSLTAAALLAITVAPALAGPAETAFLQKLTASYTGRGKLSGPDGGPISCRVVISAGGQSARYQGRCAIPDIATQAFNGSITYNDAKHQYESRSIGGTVVGVKRGNSLVFTDSSTTMSGTASSVMTMSPSSLTIDFSLVDKKGQKSSSHIVFSK
jgi:hypothetical protein